MNNECVNKHTHLGSGITYKCGLYKDHSGDHRSLNRQGEVMQRWPLTTPSEYAPWFQQEYKHGVLGVFDEAQPETVTVKLTLTDLKTIAYYMAEEEDADPTKIKIDKALKGML